jgi:hypothetical protein
VQADPPFNDRLPIKPSIHRIPVPSEMEAEEGPLRLKKWNSTIFAPTGGGGHRITVPDTDYSRNDDTEDVPMRHVLPAILLLALATAGARAQTPKWDPADEAAVRKAALDYMDGALTGEIDRLAGALHPELNKAHLTPVGPTGQKVLYRMGFSRLVETMRANAGRNAPPAGTSTVTVFDIANDVASALVVSPVYYDYLQLAKIDGAWKLVNVLWAPNRPPEGSTGIPKGGEADRQAVERAVLDYADGFYAGDAARMTRALHPEVNKIRPVRIPQTGTTFLDKMGAQLLIAVTGAGAGLLEESKRAEQVTVYDIAYDLATARVATATFIDYLHLARIDGEWKLINVLWVPNPAAQAPGH